MGMSVPERRVIVVGGGAAGMMASIFTGKAGARVTLLERGESWARRFTSPGKVAATSPMTARWMSSCTKWRGIRGSCTARCHFSRRRI